jgi:hypothetical protein
VEITLTTPALLFPAISLLLLAYTNRYLAIARLIRELKSTYEKKKNPIHLRQIRVLQKRERFIRNMQAFAIASLFCSTFSMALIYFRKPEAAGYLFSASLILMVISLAISLRDILLAGEALRIELLDIAKSLHEED